MRIVLTSNFSPWSAYSGGGQQSAHHLASTLAKRGHDVSVVYTKTPWEQIEPPEPVPYRIRWASLYHHRSQSQAPLRPLTTVTVAREVEALAREISPNGEPFIVHGQGEEAALIPRVRERLPIGFVLTSRYGSLPAAWSVDPPAPTWKRILWTMILPKYHLLGVAARAASVCSPPSHFGGRLLTRAYGIPTSRIEPVHNGVPDTFLRYRWKYRESDDRPLLFFGRFAFSKGIDTLLDALARVDDPSIRVRVVGRGAIEGEMQQRARSLGLEARVEWRPWASHEELGELIENARAVVLPSREENFSLAVLSTMAIGAPLITTDVGGTAEVAEQGVNALVCPPGDVDAVEAALRRTLDDPAAAADRGDAAARRIREAFTWEATAERFEAIYERVLAGVAGS